MASSSLPPRGENINPNVMAKNERRGWLRSREKYRQMEWQLETRTEKAQENLALNSFGTCQTMAILLWILSKPFSSKSC